MTLFFSKRMSCVTLQLCQNHKVNTHAHPYLHWEPRHESKQESGSPLWEQLKRKKLCCPPLARHLFSLNAECLLTDEDPTFLDLSKNAFFISSKLASDLTPRSS